MSFKRELILILNADHYRQSEFHQLPAILIVGYNFSSVCLTPKECLEPKRYTSLYISVFPLNFIQVLLNYLIFLHDHSLMLSWLNESYASGTSCALQKIFPSF